MDVDGVSAGPLLISYAHESDEHVAQVRRLADLLTAQGLVVHLDQTAAEVRQNWGWWTVEEIDAAERVLVVVSPAYRRRFRRTRDTEAGRGVHFEAYLITEKIYQDPDAALQKFVPVLLPGADQDQIPTVLLPYSGTHYRIPELTPAGIERLARALRGQYDVERVSARMAPPFVSLDQRAALHLTVASDSPALADEVVRALLGSGPEGSRIEFDERCTPAGALVSGPVGQIAALLTTGSDAIDTLLADQEGNRTPTVARIGVHLADRQDRAVTVATRLSLSAAATRIHAVPDAHVVLVVTDPFLAAVGHLPDLFPRRESYGVLTDADGDERCWFAVMGRTRAPKPRPAPEEEQPVAARGRRPAHVVNSGVLSGNSGTINIGTFNHSDRDMTVTIIKGHGGTR